jgi:hypothetical protein
MNEKIQEVQEMLTPGSDYQKKLQEFKEFKARGNKFAPKKVALKDIDLEEIMYDTDLKEAKGHTEFKFLGRKKETFENVYYTNYKKTFSRESKEYQKALEMKRIRDEKDPLHLLAKYNKKVYRYNFLTTMPEITKEEIVTNRNKLNKAYFLNYKFNSELGEKT